jgi:hypothetical protein
MFARVGLAFLGTLPYVAMCVLADDILVGLRFAVVACVCVVACVTTLSFAVDAQTRAGRLALLSTLCATTIVPVLISLVVWLRAIFLPESRWLFDEPEAIFWIFALLLPVGSVLTQLILIRIKKSLRSQQHSGMQL